MYLSLTTLFLIVAVLFIPVVRRIRFLIGETEDPLETAAWRALEIFVALAGIGIGISGIILSILGILEIIST